MLHAFLYLWSLPYLRWHIVVTFPVLLVLILIGWKYFLRYKNIFFMVLIGSIIWGVTFDFLATPVLHIYFFNPYRNLGISFLSLPLEEYIFIVFVPQAVTGITLLVRKVIYGKT